MARAARSWEERHHRLEEGSSVMNLMFDEKTKLGKDGPSNRQDKQRAMRVSKLRRLAVQRVKSGCW